MDWALITAANNDAVLQSCLLSSNDVSAAREVKIQRGFTSASSAYNKAIEECESEILVFAHQDIYFPEGWWCSVESAIDQLKRTDPEWGVLGVWGVQANGEFAGHLYCNGTGRVLGKKSTGPVPVRTLDEVVLIIRRSSGLRFGDDLPGFHMYGPDICLEAQKQKRNCYALSAFCVHNTNQYGMLPWDFWKSYLIMRRKWKRVLPVVTSCTTISRSGLPAMWWCAETAVHLALRRPQLRTRVADPRRFLAFAG
jgi:hypothetical protein